MCFEKMNALAYFYRRQEPSKCIAMPNWAGCHMQTTSAMAQHLCNSTRCLSPVVLSFATDSQGVHKHHAGPQMHQRDKRWLAGWLAYGLQVPNVVNGFTAHTPHCKTRRANAACFAPTLWSSRYMLTSSLADSNSCLTSVSASVNSPCSTQQINSCLSRRI